MYSQTAGVHTYACKSQIEETGPFAETSLFQPLVHQICCFKYNQIDNDSFQVASSSLLFIIICVLSNFPTLTVCLLQYILHACAFSKLALTWHT